MLRFRNSGRDARKNGLARLRQPRHRLHLQPNDGERYAHITFTGRVYKIVAKGFSFVRLNGGGGIEFRVVPAGERNTAWGVATGRIVFKVCEEADPGRAAYQRFVV